MTVASLMAIVLLLMNEKVPLMTWLKFTLNDLAKVHVIELVQLVIVDKD